MTRATEASYDEFPYPGAAFWFTHPDHLAVMAEIHGMRPADPRAARVLELGCGDGKNIISIAAALPGARCVGLDLSESQIRQASALARAAGVTNVELMQADVRDIGADFGTFDYVIAHGVYSWVPDFAREGLMAAIGHTLAPHGVAMVSYNALPGWHDLAPIRGFLKFHTDPIRSVEGRVRQARSMTDVYCRALIDLDREGREPLADKLHANVSAMSDYLLRHDWLADNHTPIYFSDFIAHAGRYGLDYLGNACPAGQNPDLLDPEARHLATQLTDRVRRQQYVDFFQHTRFRTTLLRRAETPVVEPIARDRYVDYWVESRLDPGAIPSDSITAGLSGEELTPELAQAEADRQKYQILLGALAARVPAAISVRELLATILPELVARGLDDGYGATAEGREDMLRALAGEIGWLFGRELVHLWKYPPAIATALPGPDARPRTGRLQRLLAAQRDWVTTLTHRHTPLSASEQQLLAALDGTRTVAELEAALGPETGAALKALLDKGFLLAD